jgi:hypothetical protein
MNDTRYHRHFYSTPLYAPVDATRMFAVKPLHIVARSRNHIHFGSARAKRAPVRTVRDAASVEHVQFTAPKHHP